MKYKLQVYYEPKTNSEIKSLSITYCDFDLQHHTHKYKVVMEKGGAKYKIKQYLDTSDRLLSKLATINLKEYPKTDVDKTQDYFYIKMDDCDYATNCTTDIQDILDFIKFYEVLNYDISKYEKERN